MGGARMVIIPGQKYKNIKTGNIYKVLHLANSAWDVEQILVVYAANKKDIWVRSYNEFLDKFTEEPDGNDV
jgi:hypothetical protein